MWSIQFLLQKLNSLATQQLDISTEEWEQINDELSEVIHAAASCSTIVEAEEYLDNLCTLQELLAKLHFKYEVPLSNKLRQLVREYDRCDDPDLRAFVFDKMRSGKFLSES